MLKLLQIWQYGHPTAAEETLTDAIALAKDTGFTGLLVKALDGTDFMGRFDSTPDAIRSVEQAKAQAIACHANGLRYYVWTNPLTSDDLPRQARLTGDLANATDGVFLDVEPYAKFWGAWRPVGVARGFMQDIRQWAPHAFIALQPDPRPARLAELRPEEWMPFVDAIAGQHYWNDFKSDPRQELANAVALGAQWGKPVYPTLPGNAPLDSFPLDVLATLPGFVVWRMGSTPLPTLQALGRVRTAPRPAQSEGDPVDEYVARVRAADSMADVCHLLWALAAGQRAGYDPGAAQCIEASVIRLKELAGLP